jgi:hypothetical protein
MRRRDQTCQADSAEALGRLKVTLTASTAAKIVVWREAGLFYVRLSDSTVRPQVCMAVDLFEVIAEVAGLDLEVGEQAAEAMSLAEAARPRLKLSATPRPPTDMNTDTDTDTDPDDALRRSDRMT